MFLTQTGERGINIWLWNINAIAIADNWKDDKICDLFFLTLSVNMEMNNYELSSGMR